MNYPEIPDSSSQSFISMAFGFKLQCEYQTQQPKSTPKALLLTAHRVQPHGLAHVKVHQPSSA